jgi:hypothetical protein
MGKAGGEGRAKRAEERADLFHPQLLEALNAFHIRRADLNYLTGFPPWPRRRRGRALCA